MVSWKSKEYLLHWSLMDYYPMKNSCIRLRECGPKLFKDYCVMCYLYKYNTPSLTNNSYRRWLLDFSTRLDKSLIQIDSLASCTQKRNIILTFYLRYNWSTRTMPLLKSKYEDKCHRFPCEVGAYDSISVLIHSYVSVKPLDQSSRALGLRETKFENRCIVILYTQACEMIFFFNFGLFPKRFYPAWLQRRRRRIQ